MDYYSLPVSIKELVSGFKPPSTPPSIFIAYDFKDSDSEKLFADLRSALAHSQRDATIVVHNGRVDPGDSWAVVVRERIGRSRLLIADLSQNSVEVYFECGLAWGVGRTLCPVVRSEDRKALLPQWLRDLQIANYRAETGFEEILKVIRRIASEKNVKQRNRCEVAIPGKIAILSENNEIIAGQNSLVRAACGQYGMEFFASVRLDAAQLSVDLPRDIADASLLIINIHGNFSEADLFGIFCAGAVLSHPSSGESRKKLLKQVIIVSHGTNPAHIKIFPEAAKRIRNVKIVAPSDLVHEIHSFGESYRRWVDIQSNPSKGAQSVAKPRLSHG